MATKKKKMSKVRRLQLNRVRRLRKSLGERGFILPAEAWDLANLSTQKLKTMTPDWFYKNSEYVITGADYTAIYDTYWSRGLGLQVGDVVRGTMGRAIEQRRVQLKRDLSYTGRVWEIIREAQKRGTVNNPAIGGDHADNILSGAIARLGVDEVEGRIRFAGNSFFTQMDNLVSWDYEALLKESRLTGRTFGDILDAAAMLIKSVLT